MPNITNSTVRSTAHAGRPGMYILAGKGLDMWPSFQQKEDQEITCQGTLISFPFLWLLVRFILISTVSSLSSSFIIPEFFFFFLCTAGCRPCFTVYYYYICQLVLTLLRLLYIPLHSAIILYPFPTHFCPELIYKSLQS